MRAAMSKLLRGVLTPPPPQALPLLFSHSSRHRCASTASPSFTEKEGFMSLLPEIVFHLSQDPSSPDLHPHLSGHLERALTHNLVGGKMNRGLSVPVTYSLLRPGAAHSELRKAALLGWTVELLQAFFLVADDIMDGSETRRGRPCWYRRADIGLAAFNDSILLETAAYSVLREYFGQQPGYLELLELLLCNTKLTALGQALDLSSASEYSRVRGATGTLNSFTMARYSSIVKYKTSHYSFVLPVHLAMRLSGVAQQEVLDTAEGILLDIGHYYNVCDDFLDCYGDPEVTGKVGTDIQNGKCSWLIATALEGCSLGQRRRLEQHYGSSESAEVTKVLEVYQELGLQQVFREYEEQFFAEASQRIEKVEGLPTEVFTLFLDRVYKRMS